MSEENSVVKKEKMDPAVTAGFGTSGGFELMLRQAQMFAKSKMVPVTFQGNVADCTIAMEMAARIGASPFMVMQEINIIHGRPSFSSKFLISCINACGRFGSLKFRFTGNKLDDSWGCIAWAKDAEGELLESIEVTIGMAKAEGWYSKKGSKWQTIPQLMLQYRSAGFFSRVYAPELTMGIMSAEEVRDMPPAVSVEINDSPLTDFAPATKPEKIAEIEEVKESDEPPISEEEAATDSRLGELYKAHVDDFKIAQSGVADGHWLTDWTIEQKLELLELMEAIDQNS